MNAFFFYFLLFLLFFFFPLFFLLPLLFLLALFLCACSLPEWSDEVCYRSLFDLSFRGTLAFGPSACTDLFEGKEVAKLLLYVFCGGCGGRGGRQGGYLRGSRATGKLSRLCFTEWFLPLVLSESQQGINVMQGKMWATCIVCVTQRRTNN